MTEQQSLRIAHIAARYHKTMEQMNVTEDTLLGTRLVFFDWEEGRTAYRGHIQINGLCKVEISGFGVLEDGVW